MQPDKPSIYEQITGKIVTALENGVNPWARPWHTVHSGPFRNALTNRPYRGMNVLLLVNLAWTGVLALRFAAGRGAFAAMERWQMRYLSLFAAWAAIVVIIFPPLFGYL